MRTRRLIAAALVLTGTVATAATPSMTAAASLPSPECIARTTPVPTGPARLVSDKVLKGHSGRLHELTFSSPALDGHEAVNVLLPKHYSAHPASRYHVLYLLHGSGGNQTDWVKHGAVRLLDTAAKKAHLPATITVMPNAGLEGYYTDWYGTDVVNPAEKVAPGWATFDIDELIPYIDSHYPTIASRRGRAITGLSMGGFGATSLAARNPGMFAAVGSFSGADDIDLNAPYEAIVLEGTSPAFTLGAPTLCIWGDPITHQIGLEAVDPTYLAADLANTKLYLASGNGTPGSLDGTGPANAAATAGAGAVELDVSQMNHAFVTALNTAHVAHTDYFYGAGTHSWPYWERDLTRFVPIMATTWRHLTPAPKTFSDRSAATSFNAWGWHFVADRPVEEFTYLRNVTSHGFDVAGSGTLHVTDPAGVRITVKLGSHSSQQTSFPAGAALPPGWHWVHISIGRG